MRFFQARILEWIAIAFSGGSSRPGIESGSPALPADSLPSESPRENLEGQPLLSEKEFLSYQTIIAY